MQHSSYSWKTIFKIILCCKDVEESKNVMYDKFIPRKH
jgi:hypothetical protein